MSQSAKLQQELKELNPLIAIQIQRGNELGEDYKKFPGGCLFELMGDNGDTKSIWDKNNPDEVEAARRQFDYLVKQKRYTAYYVTGDDGNKGNQMREFDPKAERIIFVPQMAGG